ncbi:MAG: YgeY family selenium metabolism-linked hydrolase [Chloroflexi bacterium]|nr:YgeY family selenium metabolism-linked hydrolase [Chloroflexota bacterium]
MSSSPPLVAQLKQPVNHQEQLDLTQFLRKLVQTPSPSTQEGAVAQLIQDELRRIGIENIRVDRLGNIIAQLGDGEGPTLLYNAHMDTVKPADDPWPYPPFDAKISNNVLYGLGASDMKASIAAMVYAAKRLVESEIRLHGNLVFAFVVQEEPCEGGALKFLMTEEGIQPNYVLLGEPRNMQVMCGHRGRVLFRGKVDGRSGHASNPRLGDNAITAAARLLFGIDLLAADLPTDPYLGTGTIAVTKIESHASSLNAIPGSCTLYVDRRLTLGETATRAMSQLEAVVEREGVNAEIEIVEYEAESYTGEVLKAREAFNAWAINEDHPYVQRLLRTVQTIQGGSPTISYWDFSTDGVYSMAEANIPTIGLGPGHPNMAHSAQEQVSLDNVASAVQVYALFAASMLG